MCIGARGRPTRRSWQQLPYGAVSHLAGATISISAISWAEIFSSCSSLRAWFAIRADALGLRTIASSLAYAPDRSSL